MWNKPNKPLQKNKKNLPGSADWYWNSKPSVAVHRDFGSWSGSNDCSCCSAQSQRYASQLCFYEPRNLPLGTSVRHCNTCPWTFNEWSMRFPCVQQTTDLSKANTDVSVSWVAHGAVCSASLSTSSPPGPLYVIAELSDTQGSEFSWYPCSLPLPMLLLINI